jgi:hypothetical protein
MASSAHPGVPAAATPHSTVREGLVTGLLGAATVALWFLLVDTIAGRPLYTPALLGAIISGTPDPRATAEGAARVSLAALYTPVHALAFAALGMLVVLLIHRAQRTPSLLALLLMLFVAFEVGFTGVVALLEQGALGGLAWYQVAAGNLVAALAMGWYVLRRHPGMGDVWRHRLDDRG